MRSLSSVRAKTTLGAILVFAFALAAAGVALIVVLERTMIDNVDLALELRAHDVGSLIENGTPPQDVAIDDEEDGLVQFVVGGDVIASSSNIEGEPAVVSSVPGEPSTMHVHAVDEAQFRVLVSQVESPDGPVTLIVGTTLENVENIVRVTITTLLIGIPSLLALAGLLTWLAVGRGLKPVEAIRAEVAEIGATDLHRRVPTPTTDDEIGRLSRTMNDMLDRIESGTLRQQRFVADASHELRTPISIIRHELEVALLHRDTIDWPTVGEEILEEDLRMQRLVDDLLWLARHDQDNKPTAMTLVDLDEIVMRQGRQNVDNGVKILTTGVGAGQVRGNADDLARVASNLVNNAVRHADHQVGLTVRTTESGQVVFHVDDDGPGVPVEKRDSILERFTRSEEARDRDSGGAGLGLAIVAEIVARHNAALTVSESPTGGARFSVEFADARSTA